MAEAIQIATNHESAISYTSNPFKKPPTDLRYKKVTKQKLTEKNTQIKNLFSR